MIRTTALLLPAVLMLPTPQDPKETVAPSNDHLDKAMIARFAQLALECVHREYPNKVAHVLQGDGDAKPPRALTPAFYGCYDWHSAVHGHWLLARVARLLPEAAFARPARAALARSLTPESIAGELEYLRGKGRETFERPYGLAWLLQLSLELHEWDDREASAWAKALAPLEAEVAARFRRWLPKLSHPIRTGEHSQSAFALGLVLDWSRGRGDRELERLIEERARLHYRGDRGWNLAFEPSGQDFLSPSLAEADLMRRVLAPPEFGEWLAAFLPQIDGTQAAAWLVPAVVTDRSDGKLVHLDGLNLARAWMLEGIAAGLPSGDARQPQVLEVARRHRVAGLDALSEQQYEGSHWLGSFAAYLVTRRGLPAPAPKSK